MRADIVILAAGQGSRMKSHLPKVLHALAGKPMLERVIQTAQKTQEVLGGGKTHVVIGYKAEQVKSMLAHYPVNWVLQKEQLGTGHAVQQTLPHCKGADVVFVLYGDVPLIRASTLQSLAVASSGERLALLTLTLDNPTGYGRIVRDGFGNVQAIIEDKDATPEQLAINEVHTGIMAIPGNKIQQWITNLDNNNAQKEYYLTDIVAQASQENTQIIHVQPQKTTEVKGVNSRKQLMELERTLQQELAILMMASGVTVMDPSRLDIRGNITTGFDVLLDVNVILEGDVNIDDSVVIEQGCVIRNSTIGKNTRIKAYSVIEDSIIGCECQIGPFARIRYNTKLADQVSVGNFVEIKQSTLKNNSKANHLSYIGDTDVGQSVNIGAGTITCNYDGVNKYRTHIGDQAFIGSNTSLVAPVTVGDEATVGAGSVITENVEDTQLAIARGRQKNIDNWHRPSKK